MKVPPKKSIIARFTGIIKVTFMILCMTLALSTTSFAIDFGSMPVYVENGLYNANTYPWTTLGWYKIPPEVRFLF